MVGIEWRLAGWSVCLPLLIFPCTTKSRRSLLAPAHPGGPGSGEMGLKRLWCGGTYVGDDSPVVGGHPAAVPADAHAQPASVAGVDQLAAVFAAERHPAVDGTPLGHRHDPYRRPGNRRCSRAVVVAAVLRRRSALLPLQQSTDFAVFLLEHKQTPNSTWLAAWCSG